MTTLSRRSFLGVALAALAVPAVSSVRPFSARADTPATLAVDLVNNSGTGSAWAYVTGTDPASGRPIFLQSDGHTVYYPSSPPAVSSPLQADCAIPLGSSITVPRMVGGRVWFSLDQQLTFLLNPGDPPGIVMPSAANPDDPNHAVQWGFCELTYDASQLFANISFVDLVSLPIALALDDGQQVGGLPNGGLAQVAAALRSQSASDGAAWDQLIVSDGSGNPLRVISPNLLGNDRFAGYFDSYVDAVWSKYSAEDLVIDTQYTWGTVTGRVQGDQLTFPGIGSFGRPSSAAIFSCSTAPFTTGNDEMGNLSARLAAGFNRTTLLGSATQPADTAYYAQAHTNHYSRILHSIEAGGLGYAFPYDDVHSSGGVDVEGKVQSGAPGRLTITVGAP